MLLVQDISTPARESFMKQVNPRVATERVYLVNGILEALITTEQRGDRLDWHLSIIDTKTHGKPVNPAMIGILMESKIFKPWMRKTKLHTKQMKNGYLHAASYKIR